MNKYSGTKTEQNLRTAFSGESEARNKYTFFASVAKKEGYEQIAALFQKTADNEREHAKLWFKELNGIGDTAENLNQRPRVKTTSGQICMPVLQRLRRKRDLRSWPLKFRLVAEIENIMRALQSTA
mgnify:CR=1 FL=1